MPKFVYSSAAGNAITFNNPDDLDNTFKVGSARSWTDSSKTVRFNRLSFTTFGFVFVAKPNCADKCLDQKSTNTITTKIDRPAPKSEDERTALIAEYTSHHNNVLKALTTYKVAAGNLPSTSAEFDGVAA